MKNILLKFYSFCFLLVIVSFFSACSDDKITMPAVDGNTSLEKVELKRINTFFDLDLPVKGDWTVVYAPEWALPMEEQGRSGEAVRLFVETNDEESDRTDTLKLAINDNSELKIVLVQHGTFSDDENGSSLEYEDMKLTYGVGFCVDVLKRPDNGKYKLLSNTPLNFKKLIAALEEAGESDALYKEENYYSRTESVTGNSTLAIANQLSINAGIEVGISAFKGSVEGGYSKNESGNERMSYAMEEIQHIVGSRYMRAGMLRYLAQHESDIFQKTFLKYINKLKDNPNDVATMKQIFSTYGTHIITHGTLGGELKLSMQMKVTDDTSDSDIHAALGLGAKVIDVSGEFSMTEKEKAIASNTTISLVTYGGSNVYTIAPGTTFQQFQQTVKDKDKLDAWVQTIQNGTQLALIDIVTTPIYELMPTEEARTAMRNYLVGDYQKSVYADDETYTGPNLYMVHGYDISSNVAVKSELYIPEIDVRLEAYRKIIPELSEDYITVIYSGTKEEMNYKSGFFVGNKSLKPCKFRYTNKGEFTTEVFDLLDEGFITELYVDATGDVTIAPKGAEDMYQDLKFTNQSVDVTLAQEDFRVASDMSVTGQTDKSLILADGVTLTLNGLKINNQIKCEGNAHIILADGSTNVINTSKLFGMAGIGVASSGKLVLAGNGRVEITAGEYGSGIGSSYYLVAGKTCGDIEIQGGTLSVKGGDAAPGIGFGVKGGTITVTGGDLTVTGGWCGPGIGTTYGGSCEGIVISGGTVVSVGNDVAAGIGTGELSSCKSILITKDVKSVIAQKGNDGYESIGLGSNDDGSTCGEITIEDPSKVTQK